MRAILTYHSIDVSGSPISCAPEAFERHLRWFASGRVRVTTVEELTTLPDDIDAVALTFDDALESFGSYALPRLRDQGLVSTVFVVADHTGGTNAWGGVSEPHVPTLSVLSWTELAEAVDHGVHLGSHSRTHPDLTRLDSSAVRDELEGATELIEQHTGARPRLFAYPYGRVDDRTEGIVAGLHPLACTTELRVLDGVTRPARLPRLDAYYFQRPGILESWGTPSFSRWLSRRRWLRSWRAGVQRW